TLGNASGQVFSEDITNPASPTLQGVLLQPDNGRSGPQTGFIDGGGLVPNSQLYYAVGSTSLQNFGAWNQGVGKLLVVDVTSPAAMTVVREVDVAATKMLYKPEIQGNLAVALGDNGGIGIFYQPDSPVANLGNIVVTTFDLADPRNPQVLTTLTTAYKPGVMP